MGADLYDAVVVGAGPAGSVTALLLARAGRRVLLLDRHEFPRDKACGDCMSPEVTRQLDALGLLQDVMAARPARLEGWRIHAPDGARFGGTFARAAAADPRVRSALALSRRELDSVLVRAACAAGVELREGVRVEDVSIARNVVTGVTVRDRTGRRCAVAARLIVGADGLRSVVARRIGATAPAGPLRKHSFTVHARLRADFAGAAGEMHVIAQGCIGIAPVEAGANPMHNVTFVTVSGARPGDARTVMRSMIDQAPGLRDRRIQLHAAIDAAAPPLASGPFDRPARFVARDGAALVGDAAGYYDPFTGQGVCHAIGGAMRLAAVTDHALSHTGPVCAVQLAPYASWLLRSRRPAQAVQRTIEYVTARPALMNRFTRAIDRTPAFADALVGVTGDIAPVRALAGRPLVDLGAALLSQPMRSSR